MVVRKGKVKKMLDKIAQNNSFETLMNAIRDYDISHGERGIIGTRTVSDSDFDNALRNIAIDKRNSEAVINDIKELLDPLPTNSWMHSHSRLVETMRALGEIGILYKTLVHVYGFNDDVIDRAMLATMHFKYNKYYNKLKNNREFEKTLAIIEASSNAQNVTKVTKFVPFLIEGGEDLYAKLAKIYYLIIIVDLFRTVNQSRASITLETSITEYSPIIQHILSTTAHYRAHDINSTEVIANIISFMDVADENDITYIISLIITIIDDFGEIETELCKLKVLKKSVAITGDMLSRSRHINGALSNKTYDDFPLVPLIKGYDCSDRATVKPIINIAFNRIKPLLQEYRDYINSAE